MYFIRASKVLNGVLSTDILLDGSEQEVPAKGLVDAQVQKVVIHSDAHEVVDASDDLNI